ISSYSAYPSFPYLSPSYLLYYHIRVILLGDRFKAVFNLIKGIDLYNYSPVSNPLRDPFAVQILQQRDRIFSGDASQILEATNFKLRRAGLFCRKFASQLGQRSLMKYQIVGNLDQDFFAEKQGHDLLCARFVNFQPG